MSIAATRHCHRRLRDIGYRWLEQELRGPARSFMTGRVPQEVNHVAGTGARVCRGRSHRPVPWRSGAAELWRPMVSPSFQTSRNAQAAS